MMSESKRLSISIAALLTLCVSLCICSFALGMTVSEVSENTFRTGGIEIDLNGGKPIIEDGELVFEPGATIEKAFYIRNNGTWSVYYKLYFTQVSGTLGDVIDVTLFDSDGTVLLSGKMSELTREEVPAAENELNVGERHDLTVRFDFPATAGNDYQSEALSFALSALAVQTKNNPDKEFD